MRIDVENLLAEMCRRPNATLMCGVGVLACLCLVFGLFVCMRLLFRWFLGHVPMWTAFVDILLILWRRRN